MPTGPKGALLACGEGSGEGGENQVENIKNLHANN